MGERNKAAIAPLEESGSFRGDAPQATPQANTQEDVQLPRRSSLYAELARVTDFLYTLSDLDPDHISVADVKLIIASQDPGPFWGITGDVLDWWCHELQLSPSLPYSILLKRVQEGVGVTAAASVPHGG